MTNPTGRTRTASRWAVWPALVLSAALGALTVMVATGMAMEYGDTSASTLEVAWSSLRDWSFGVALAAVFAAAGVWAAKGSRLVSGLAVGIVAATCLGAAGGAVWGVERKFERYDAAPDCTDGFSRGPAVPVTAAAQQGFESLEHPGVFGGGGASGIDGCVTQLITDGAVDVREHYRSALPAAGWTIARETDGKVRATKGDQAFELGSSSEGQRWEIWIGPRALSQQALAEGQVGPRT